MPNSPEGWKMIAQKFEDECHFRNCIGALDGRHMAIVNPLHAGSTFYNYKGTFSIVLLAMCDANYCFTYANIGAQGRISDGGVFNSCSLSEKLDRNTLHLPPPESLSRGRKPTPYVIVADSAFALKPNIMIPYSGHNSTVKRSRERTFNYRLSSARSRIENTFGIMSTVLRVFRKPMLLEPQKACIVVECGVLLHNFLRRSRTSTSTYAPTNMFDRYITGEDGKLTQVDGSWRHDEPLTSCTPLSAIPRRSSNLSKEIRDEFAEFYISEEGKVPWQDYLQ